jgi:hypothetical protein
MAYISVLYDQSDDTQFYVFILKIPVFDND